MPLSPVGDNRLWNTIGMQQLKVLIAHLYEIGQLKRLLQPDSEGVEIIDQTQANVGVEGNQIEWRDLADVPFHDDNAIANIT